MDGIYSINYEEKIKLLQKGIDNILQNVKLTDEQINKGRILCEVYDQIDEQQVIDWEIRTNYTENKEVEALQKALARQHNHKLSMFKKMSGLLDFDYEQSMQLYRRKNLIELYTEVLDGDGLAILVDGCGEFPDTEYIIQKKTCVSCNEPSNDTVSVLEVNTISDIVKEIKYDVIKPLVDESDGLKKLVHEIF